MIFLKHTEIDFERWDKLVSTSPKENVMCYSWYLSATAKKWGAILSDDYSFGWPFPYKNRGFYKKLFQHPYSRNLDYFGDENQLDEALRVLKKIGRFHFRMPHLLPQFNSQKRCYQAINLLENPSYKTNAKRILKKQEAAYHFAITASSTNVKKLYFEHSFNKIRQQSKNQKFFSALTSSALEHHKGEAIEVYNKEDECVAAAFFLKDKSRVYYLIGDSLPHEKKNGVMFCLMDFAIRHYMGEYKTFDFGGSNIESVATFYRKMGGKDVTYFEFLKK